jgi:hypothetical protein
VPVVYVAARALLIGGIVASDIGFNSGKRGIAAFTIVLQQ